MTKTIRPVVMLVDAREKDQEFLDYLKRFGVHIQTDMFEVGDIGIAGRRNFIIEHKSVEDLAQSLVDKRLFKQIKNMVEMAQMEEQELEPVLLLVGDVWKLWKIREYSVWQIAAILNSIQFGWGVKIMYAHNNMFAAARLVALARKYQIGEDTKKEHPMRFGTKSKMTEEELARYVLEGFPGISAVRAKNLLLYYGTLGKTIEAMRDGSISEMEIVGAKKIGKKTSETIKNVFDYGVEVDGGG